MIALTFLIALAGFACFGLANDRHHGRQLGRALTRATARRLRVVGWLALALAFGAALHGWGPVIGPIGWFAAVMAAAAATFLALNLLPGRTQH